MSDAGIVYSVLAVVVVLFVWNRLPVEIVAMGAALSLAATGVLTFEQSLSGFGDTTVIFIAALFVVSEAIDATGVTAWAGQLLIDRAGNQRNRLVLLMMLLVALFTALISVNGAVAALLPMVVVIAVRLRISTSYLLMPLAFAAHAGSLLALTGTPVHILVSDAASEAGEAGFNFFEFALAGIPIVAGSVAIVVLFGSRLLPDRTAHSIPPNLSDHARTLASQYSLRQAVARLEVQADSPLIGTAATEVSLDHHPEAVLVGIQGSDGALALDSPIRRGDVLILRGAPDQIESFANHNALHTSATAIGRDEPLITRQLGVAEVVVPPRSELIGVPVFPGMVTASGDYVILAVQRNGLDRDSEPTPLAVGDTLLLQGTWDSLDRGFEGGREVMVVDDPALVRRQAVPMGPRARRAIVILGVMVVLLGTGALPAAAAALLAAAAMILSGVVSISQAYRSISWTTIVLLGGMIPLSDAVRLSGAADQIADLLVVVVGDAGPHVLLLALFLLTALFGQLISNMATALIVIPIAVTAATDFGISVRPVLMCLTIAAAAAFLTPVATPANLMVMGPGGYEFRDYWKLGLPMLLLFLVVAVFYVPLIWSF